MKISIYKYNLPFVRPFKNASGTLKSRKGILINLQHKNIDLTAEASPLPGFSRESFDDAYLEITTSLKNWANYLSTEFTLESLKYYCSASKKSASVKYALSVLGVGILSNRNQQSASTLLGFSLPEKLKVNAVLGISSILKMEKNFHDLYSAGYRTFKIKTGNETRLLFSFLKKAAKQKSDVLFRIDANQSWELENAIENLKKLENYPVEYCEEPVNCSDENLVQKLVSESSVPVAVDDSFYRVRSPAKLISTGNFQYVILKPTLFGSVFDLIETIKMAIHLDSKVVLTSAFESNVGIGNIAFLAAILGSDDVAHGVGTGSIFKQNTTYTKKIQRAVIETKELIWSFTSDEINYESLQPGESYEL